MTGAQQPLALGFASGAARAPSGAQRRDDALRRLESSSRAWLLEMRREAERIARERGAVSADDLRDFADQLRVHRGLVPRSSNAAGAIFRGRQWEQRGWIKSTKPTHNATDLRVWGLRPVHETPQGLAKE